MAVTTRTRKVGMAERGALKTYAWLDERFRIRNAADKLAGFYFQLNMQLPRSHTEKYKLRSIWYWYPMYTLGSIALLSFIIATISGILLTFWYVPSTSSFIPTNPSEQSLLASFGDIGAVPPSRAWVSVGEIMLQVPFGFMIRALHFWSAMVMVAAVFLHMMRVYWTAAYKKPREINWIIGFLLIIFTLGLGYTGYLLPWSQLSFWAGTIGNEMASASPPPQLGQVLSSFMFGQEFGGQQTLSRMYILHVLLLPLLTYALIGLHITIVWIQGIAEPH